MQNQTPQEGYLVDLGGFETLYKILSETTNGSVGIVEHTLPPGALAGPLHRHSREDEVSYVFEGELTVQQGEEVTTVPAGSYIAKPRGIWHTFWNAGSTPVRLMEIIAPGGFERYFAELEEIIPKDGPPDANAIAALGARYGLEFDMASVPVLMKQYGIRLL